MIHAKAEVALNCHRRPSQRADVENICDLADPNLVTNRNHMSVQYHLGDELTGALLSVKRQRIIQQSP
jgi:hypothetical protein